MSGGSTTPHCPQAMRQCEALFPLPTSPRQCVTLPTAPCPQQRCSRAHTVQCGAERQAMRHHREGTGGAARHAGCSGQQRPCVTARRRRQGSVDQVRECTGPAMPQHTYTQRAHNTHSPARLPVPVGRHPGLCPLVTAPSAQHNTAQHSTTQHNTTQRSTTLLSTYLPTGPAGRSDHPLGRTPHPPRPVRPVVHPRRPYRKLRPPPGQDSPSP